MECEFEHRHPQDTIDWEKEISDGHFAESEMGRFYITVSRYRGGGYELSQDLNGRQSSTLGLSLEEIYDLYELLGRFIEQEDA